MNNSILRMCLALFVRLHCCCACTDSMALAENVVCSEQHLAEIALWIVEWREVSPFLGLTEAEEHELVGSVRSQKIAMLRLWKKKQGSKATYKRLCRAFRKCGLCDLEEKVKELLTEKSSCSTCSSSDEASDEITSKSLDTKHSDSDSSHSDNITYLRTLYMSLSHNQTPQHWTHLPRCDFIHLSIVGAQRLRSGPEEKIVKLSQQGKIETVMSQNERIPLNQLLILHKDACPHPPPPSPLSLILTEQTSQDSDQLEYLRLNLLSLLRPNPRTILIEGAPGGGKSTLALHICHQWAQGASWLAKFDIVILAYLQDKEIQNAKTLADIIPACYF